LQFLASSGGFDAKSFYLDDIFSYKFKKSRDYPCTQEAYIQYLHFLASFLINYQCPHIQVSLDQISFQRKQFNRFLVGNTNFLSFPLYFSLVITFILVTFFLAYHHLLFLSFQANK
jgi:hypothetical protein